MFRRNSKGDGARRKENFNTNSKILMTSCVGGKMARFLSAVKMQCLPGRNRPWCFSNFKVFLVQKFCSKAVQLFFVFRFFSSNRFQIRKLRWRGCKSIDLFVAALVSWRFIKSSAFVLVWLNEVASLSRTVPASVMSVRSVQNASSMAYPVSASVSDNFDWQMSN